MAKKLYQYTVYKQDGTIEKLEPRPKMEWPGEGGLYELIGNGCGHIELLPKDYVPKEFGRRGEYFIDGEGRFNSTNYRNPHFKVLTGDIFSPSDEWDVVGNVVKEEVYHAENAETKPKSTGAATRV
jgi:hypothetical protein